MLPAYRGAADAAAKIFRQEGWRALYSGLAPALVGSGVSWGAYLYLYERVKAWHRRWQGSERLGAGWNLLSAAQAGAMVCLVTNPIWLVKTRMALQRRAGAAAPGVVPYRGMVDALVRIGREEGLRGYYKGLGPSLLLQTTHGAIQFAVYEELKGLAARARWDAAGGGGWPRLQRAGGGGGERDGSGGKGSGSGGGSGGELRQLGSAEVSAYGALSKLAAAVTTYPTQVVRARLQQRFEAGRAVVYRTAGEAVSLTWTREGVAGFYKGLAPSLLRVMPQSAVTLAVYEGLLQWLAAAAPDEGGGGGGEVKGGGGGGEQDKGGRQQQGGRGRPPPPSLTDQARPLVIAADSQAEQ